MFGIHRNFPDGGGGGDIPTDLGDGIVLFWNFMDLPLGALTGSETPQYMASGMSVASISNMEKYAKGISVDADSEGSISFSGVPAKSLGRRRYVLTYSLDETGATNNLIDLNFNKTDANNYWLYRVIDVGGGWSNDLYQYSSGTPTLRGIQALNVNIENCTMTAIIEDYGDELYCVALAAEDGTGNIEHGTTIVNYYAATRADQTATGFDVTWRLPEANKMRLQSIMVQDFE